jgi:hypothetical protein
LSCHFVRAVIFLPAQVRSNQHNEVMFVYSFSLPIVSLTHANSSAVTADIEAHLSFEQFSRIVTNWEITWSGIPLAERSE